MNRSTTATSLNSRDTVPCSDSIEWTMEYRGSSKWQIVAGLEHEFLDANGLRLEEWRRAGRAEIVKTGSHRSVYRLELSAGTFFLKHDKAYNWRSRLRNIVRSSKGVLENRAAKRIAQKGIHTIEPVAVGQTFSRPFVCDSFLISRAIKNTVPLDKFLLETFQEWPIERQTIFRQRLAKQLGKFVAKLHDGGVIHRDFHPGNLLLHLDQNDRPELSLIDLHPVSFYRKIGHRQIQKNLAFLNRFFAFRSTRSDRLRFFHAYYRNVIVESFAEAAQRMEAYCKADSFRAGRKRDKKWARGNRHILIADSEDVRCRGVARLDREVLLQLRDDPEQLFGKDRVVEWQQNANGHRAAIVRFSISGQQQQYLYTSTKRWNSRKRKQDPLRSPAFQKSRASTAGFVGTSKTRLMRLPQLRQTGSVRQAWEAGFAFRRRGIKTATPILFISRKTNSYIEEYLLTEEIPHTVMLNEFFDSQFSKMQKTERELWSIQHIRVLADQIRIIHENGFDHPDLRSGNILVSRNSEDTCIWMIGLDAVQQRWRLSRKQKAANLARLYESIATRNSVRRTNRLRFLLRYLSGKTDNWKRFWRQIERFSAQSMGEKHLVECQQSPIIKVTTEMNTRPVKAA